MSRVWPRILAIVGVAICLPAIASAQSETVEYYGTDAVGSIRVVYDASGNVLSRQDYSPFGTELLPGTALPPESFAGDISDDESNQAYFLTRQYEPRTGRFEQPDFRAGGLFEPQQWNRYSYALNSPLTFIDPNGLDPFKAHTRGCDDSRFWTLCMAEQTFVGPVVDSVWIWLDPILGHRGAHGGDDRNRPNTQTPSPPPPPPPPPGPPPPGPPPDDPKCGGDSDAWPTYFVNLGGSWAVGMGPDLSGGVYYVPSTGEIGLSFSYGFAIGLSAGLGVSGGRNGQFRDFGGRNINLTAGAFVGGLTATKDEANRRWTGVSGTFSPVGMKAGWSVGKTNTVTRSLGHVNVTCNR
jgi:RHS repeat-associated protein